MLLSDGRTLAVALSERAGVSLARAELVVQEYERFLYLVASTGLPLAPSRAVDAAWHLHLADAASYDAAMVADVIGRKVVHVEGRPAPLDDPAYATSFKVYREEFGLRPPWRVWPSAREDRRATVAVVVALLAACGAVLAYSGHQPLWAWLSGGVTALAGMAYAAIAPYAAANRAKEGCTGCVAGAEDVPERLAKE